MIDLRKVDGYKIVLNAKTNYFLPPGNTIELRNFDGYVWHNCRPFPVVVDH